MRKENPARFSSAVGEAWMHCEFKVKYCHKIFDDEIYREGLRTLLLEAAYNNEIPTGVIGFAEDHVHFMADIGNYSRPQVAKLYREGVITFSEAARRGGKSLGDATILSGKRVPFSIFH